MNEESNQTEDTADEPEAILTNPRAKKLVAKISGDMNITSASISTDGNMVAVTTAAETKLFTLTHGDDGSVTMKKMSGSDSLRSLGGRIIRFSPDSKWLAIVRNDNRVDAVRVNMHEGELSLHKIITKLARLDRDIEKHILFGGLGTYDRSINHAAFSSDSRILVVSDLAGYIDSWVLEGIEDLSQPSEEIPECNEGDSESEDEDKPLLIYAQHWTPNPSASLIPKLPSTPVVLSFRPAPITTKAYGALPHATRHNPHPVSHELHVNDDRLFIVTAGSVGNSSKVLEFNVLKGSLTPWSRANPISNFPEEYKGLRDQAMGCVWDVTSDKQRIWLYGSSWLWMFDLSRNLPIVEATKTLTNGHSTELTNGDSNSRKRKRHAELSDAHLRKGTSGAGSKVPDNENNTGMSRKMQKYITGDDTIESRDVHQTEDAMDVDDSEDSDMDEVLDVPNRSTTTTVSETKGSGHPHWWRTYKYRPIMGIVPLEGGLGLEDDALEVAIVERPIWEADLPPRYYGDQEWEKAGVIE